MTENIGQVVAHSLLMVANLFSALKISKLSVPELAQSNSTVILDCEYSALDDKFLLQWLFNKQVVYEWRPGREPVVQGILQGRIDESYRVSDDPLRSHRALRIGNLQPEMSGDYTCTVKSDAAVEDHQTKSLLVYSPEHEFVLTINYDEVIDINCIARGLYPQPSLILERNRDPIPKQDHRVWRNGSLYDASGSGSMMMKELQDKDRITCRIMMPQAGYTAMREKLVNLYDLRREQCYKQMRKSNSTENVCNNAAKKFFHVNIALGVYIAITILTLSKAE